MFRRLKWSALAVLLTIYYITPWIRWDRGPGSPDQAVLIDMTHERAWFFFIEIWAREIYYLTGLMVLAAIGLFFVTSLAGRIWCGYSCPQTVWTDLFMWVERRIEGDRNARIKLDKAALSLAKVAKKGLKHIIWLLIAVGTGGAWIFYFNDAPTTLRALVTGEASTAIYFFIALFSTITYVFAGWAREQVCTYMCPWPRFQAAMFDENTLIVTYQEWRGEPRGRHHKGDDWSQRGDCVSCRQCVAVCPTGIDIRDGQQLECIGCGLCIDACDTVMDRIGRPRGLIAFDTTANQVARAEGRAAVLKLLRPRTVIYMLVMAAISGAMIWSLATRPTLHINVLHDRAPLFVPLSDGSIRNGYTLRISNMRRDGRGIGVTLDGVPGATFSIIGTGTEDAIGASLWVGHDTVATWRVFVTVPAARVSGESMPLGFLISDTVSGESERYETVFRGPAR